MGREEKAVSSNVFEMAVFPKVFSRAFSARVIGTQAVCEILLPHVFCGMNLN